VGPNRQQRHKGRNVEAVPPPWQPVPVVNEFEETSMNADHIDSRCGQQKQERN
jgi:hypothetical protein